MIDVRAISLFIVVGGRLWRPPQQLCGIAVLRADRVEWPRIGRLFFLYSTKLLLSILWIVVMINMLKADVLSLYIPNSTDEVLKAAGDIPITLLMLIGSVMMETSILVIVLSYVLERKLNRRLNIIVAVLTIIFIWGGMSTYPHYLFIATVETVCLLFIIRVAWKWSESEILVT